MGHIGEGPVQEDGLKCERDTRESAVRHARKHFF